jgi:NTE family protein
VRIGSSGVIGGGRLARRLEQAIGNTSIEDLPVRFAAIATEVGTGTRSGSTRGTLALALRASYALPGIFPPVRLGGRWADGRRAGQSGASHCGTRVRRPRRSIAVNLDADRFARGATIASHGSDETDDAITVAPNKLATDFLGLGGMFGVERALRRQFSGRSVRPSFSTVMIEAFNIMQDRLTRMRLAGDPPTCTSPRTSVTLVGSISTRRGGDRLPESGTEKALSRSRQRSRRWPERFARVRGALIFGNSSHRARQPNRQRLPRSSRTVWACAWRRRR